MFGTDTNTDRVSIEMPPPALEQDPEQVWHNVVEPVDDFLDLVGTRLAAQVDSFDPEVAQYARYALTSQGKQLRPALLGLSARVFSQPDEAVATAAVIIEMIHLATLVHDDIMDEASVRRSRPTLAANWGNSISVLLGDTLFAHALELASGYPTTEVCKAVSAATKTVCSGEILQTLRRNSKSITRKDYFRILEMKTAELFALSCDLGAALSGGDQRQRNALRAYGLNLGVAYQVYDDCLDLFGTESVAGKSLGTDLACGKITLPLLVVLEQSHGQERQRALDLVRHWNPDLQPELQRLLAQHDALTAAQSTVLSYLSTAREALDHVPDCSSKSALEELTHFLSQQTSHLGV